MSATAGHERMARLPRAARSGASSHGAGLAHLAASRGTSPLAIRRRKEGELRGRMRDNSGDGLRGRCWAYWESIAVHMRARGTTRGGDAHAWSGGLGDSMSCLNKAVSIQKGVGSNLGEGSAFDINSKSKILAISKGKWIQN